jgi:PAS domain S-box-containing protein
MDWASIATFLAENSKMPVALLDREGRIRVFSGAMEAVLGWRRDDVEGREWDSLAPTPPPDSRPQWIPKVLRGELRHHRSEVLTRDGQRLVLALEVSTIGSGESGGIVLSVQTATPSHGPGHEPYAADLDYRVLATVDRFGKLLDMAWVGGAVEGAGRSCFEVIYKRSEPCNDCPALRSAVAPWPRISVRRVVADPSRVAVVTARPADDASVRLRVRVITDQELTAIHDAKIAALARRANLTERETDVLTHLMAGRSLDDVSALMNMSRRTVKFHQGNILQKLGADSRIDLIRLTGF